MEKFYIPSYQRGYRWTKQQVTDLLNDLWEFQSKSENEDKARFYCLQPIVVKKLNNGDWELVDGQQRLTTIFLILTCLKPLLEFQGKSSFTLNFETREYSGEFLQNVDDSKRSDNIDYHHICNALDVIKEWFNNRDGSHKMKFANCLLNDDEVGRNVKVIWYELTDDPISAFTRLNVGKIPLTNAELIRALFLRSGNFNTDTITYQQLKIAQEWDSIEKVLQLNEVWYFLHSSINSPASRIEYIFQLIAREQVGQTTLLVNDPYQTFHFYNEKFNTSAAKAETEWLSIKQYFMTLEEWFNDNTLYHLIGFLIHNGDDILEIRKASKNIAKSEFQRILKKRIFKRIMNIEYSTSTSIEDLNTSIKNRLDDLDYEQPSDKPIIRSFLLLFNIASLLQNEKSHIRFPFDRFKNEKWDIEHIRSVKSNNLQANIQRQWLEQAYNYLIESDVAADIDLSERTKNLLDTEKFDTSQFNLLYNDLLKHFKEDTDTETDNSIGNLTLLDSKTNSSYKNAVFPVKRKRILGLDKSGTFVPLCTKNVFLKCYSKKINNMMFWSMEDRKNYHDAIVETLADFLSDKSRTKYNESNDQFKHW
jgi:hypothetical protein